MTETTCYAPELDATPYAANPRSWTVSGSRRESWAALERRLVADARDDHTAASLLRCPEPRRICQALAAAGKQYSAEAEVYARRPVVREAVAILRERLNRRREASKRAAGRTPNYFAEEAQRRAAARVKAAVAAAADGLYRVSKSRWAGGNHTTTVHVGEQRWKSAARDGRAVGADGDSSRAWSSNGKWSGKDSSHTFQVPADWLAAVHARGLAVVDGMLTLDAAPVQGHGPELYRASWVEQGRGFGLNCVSGYIARLTHEDRTYTYHAPSARAALDGVQRKAKLRPARRKGTLDLNRLVRRHGELPVYWQDARECGLCAPGIRNWCAAVGCDTDTATVAEVVAGYRLRPLPEVIQVIRRVVRDRANREPVDLSLPTSSLETEGRVIFDSEGGFRIEPSAN